MGEKKVAMVTQTLQGSKWERFPLQHFNLLELSLELFPSQVTG